MCSWRFLKFRKVGRMGVLLLDNPPLNIITEAMCEELTRFLKTPQLSDYDVLVIAGEGKHFSAGASVEEHLPGKVETMLPKFHELLLTLASYPIPTVAAITGCCLGGGLELARACYRVVTWSTDNLQIGVPEIKLACFPPFALVVFPRISDDLEDSIRFLLTGEILKGKERDQHRRAWKMGLIDRGFPEITELDEMVNAIDHRRVFTEIPSVSDQFPKLLVPSSQMVSWEILAEEVKQTYPHLSSFVLQKALDVLIVCSRMTSLEEALRLAERVYLEELVPHEDYKKGMMAFLEKSRKPKA